MARSSDTRVDRRDASGRRRATEWNGVAPWRQALDEMLVERLELAERWIRRRWLLIANLAALLTLFGALLAPVLDALALDAAGTAIRTAYLLICPQRPAHSYFVLGHQMALEQRMLAMFAAQLLGGLAYGLLRRRLRPLDWRILAVCSLPLAWDGFSQMLGFRESTWLIRTATGALFNLAFVAWVYPRLDRVAAIRVLRFGVAEAERTR